MDEILTELRTLLLTDLTSRGITTFFKGEQQIPAQSDAPVVMVYEIETRTKRSGTVRDNVEYDIAVEVQINVKTYFDSSAGQGTQLDGRQALMQIFEERETDGDLKTNTVKGILNANLTINNKVLYTDNVRLTYPTVSQLASSFPMAGAKLTFTAHDRPNRT